MTEFGDNVNRTFGFDSQQAKLSAVSSFEDDPEQAARALKLSDHTGMNPSIIYGDVEAFDQRTKAQTVSKIIESNGHLQDYINSHPLAAKLSNDDWGQLDTVSEHMNKVSLSSHVPPQIMNLPRDIADVAKGAIEGLIKPFSPPDPEELKLREVMKQVAIEQGSSEEEAERRVGIVEGRIRRGEAITGALFALPTIIGSPLIGLFRSFVARPLEETTGAPKEVTEQFTMALLAGLHIGKQIKSARAEAEAAKPVGIMGSPIDRGKAGEKAEPKPIQDLDKAQEIAAAIDPYLQAGEEPPVGVHPVIDKLKTQQSKADIKWLDEALAESEKSATKGRNPEIFAGFIRQHTEAEIWVSFDAIQKLYGDKLPHVEDNILGWVEGIEDKLRAAEATGGDVSVPLADWLAKVDPSIAKELHDDIRVRPGGLTLNEGKELTEQKQALEVKAEEPKAEGEEVQPTIVDTVRSASALKPLFEEGPAEQLKIKKRRSNQFGGHDFEITDEKGSAVGSLNITEQHEGLDLHVDWIGAGTKVLNSKGGVDNVFGPGLIRGLLEQLKEQFPKAEFISGDRVSGAREAAGKTGQVRIPLRRFSEENLVDLSEMLKEGIWEPFGMGAEALIPTEKWTAKEQEIIDKIDKVYAKIIPKGVEFQPARQLQVTTNQKTRNVAGLHMTYKDRLPVILVALDRANPLGTARHEAIHHLRQYGFFTPEEWSILREAAVDQDWINIERAGRGSSVKARYKGMSVPAVLEEAIADAFKYWERKPEAEGPVGKIFAKMKDFFDQIKQAIKEALGYEPTVEDLFKKVERGEIGSREGTAPLNKQAFKAEEEPVLPGMTRQEEQEDLDLFDRAKSIGMTADQYKRYMKLIERRNTEDAEAQLARVTRDEAGRQTKEWKENMAKVRDEVAPEIENRPDIAVGAFFRNGILYGEDTHKRPKLSAGDLSKEQREALPDSYVSDKGIHPDDVAGLFGYQSGAEMVERLTQYEKERGELSHNEYVKKVTEAEVEKQMGRRYGNLGENILKEAEDHVYGSTQMDILHEQTIAMGMRAGSEMPFTKKDITEWVKTAFGDSIVGSAKFARDAANVGKAGRKVQAALLNDEPTEAFKAAQNQEFAALLAKEAKGLEKEVSKDLNLITKYIKTPSLNKVAQPYTDQIHALLNQVGFELKRTSQNLNDNLKGVSFEQFRQSENAKGAGILDPQMPRDKQLDQFTVNEYRNFMATIQSMDYSGRQQKLIQVGQTKEAYESVIDRTAKNLDTLEKKGFDPTAPSHLRLARKIIREVDARLVKIEQLADWIDKNDTNGPLNQTVIRPMFAAQHRRGDIIAGLAEDIKKIPVDRKWGRGLTDAIDNTILPDADGNMARLTNENKIVIALNFGNASNRSVLARGMNWQPEAIQTFLDKHMTKMDWDFVRGIWKVFDKVAPLVEEATLKRSGVSINMVEPMDVKSPLGKVEGGYYPLIKDPRDQLLGKQVKTDLVDKPFFDPLPMARAMNLRTGAAYPIDLTLNSLNSRINETLHAALFQDPIRNARKVIGDPIIRQGIDKAFGPEYVTQFDKWLDDIANNGGEHGDAIGSWISRNMRENVVFGLMGYKVSTAAIHALSAGVSSAYEVGPLALGKNLRELGIAQAMPDIARRFFANEKQMWEQVDWAVQTFPELRNRMQDIGKDMQAQLAGIVSKGFLDDAARIRAVNIAWSMKMVATLDQLTATPVALAAYKKARSDGMGHADAVYAGEKAVRQAHGSASLVGRANIGRGEVMKWLTVAYNGYWNHNYNRTRSAVRDIKAPDIDFSQRLVAGSAALTALIIAPALIHYAVRGSENESYTGAAAEALVSQFGGQVPIVNTLLYSMMHNRDPHLSPADEIFSKALAVKRDMSQVANGKKADQFLKHALEAPGFFAGLGASSQIATTIQFNRDVMLGKERPKSVYEWARGEITGHTKPHTPRRR